MTAVQAARPRETGKAPDRIRLATVAAYLVATGAVLLSNLRGEDRALGCVVLTILVLLPGLLVAWVVDRARTVRAAAGGAWLQEFGRPAVAEVLTVFYLQEAILGDPVLRTTVLLSPTDGAAPVTGTRDMYLSSMTVPWIGDRLPAYYDPADPDRFLLVTTLEEDAPPRVRELYRQIRPEPDTHLVVEPAEPAEQVGQDASLTAIARLGVLEQHRLSGALAEDDYQQQRMVILDQHFA